MPSRRTHTHRCLARWASRGALQVSTGVDQPGFAFLVSGSGTFPSAAGSNPTPPAPVASSSQPDPRPRSGLPCRCRPILPTLRTPSSPRPRGPARQPAPPRRRPSPVRKPRNRAPPRAGESPVPRPARPTRLRRPRRPRHCGASVHRNTRHPGRRLPASMPRERPGWLPHWPPARHDWPRRSEPGSSTTLPSRRQQSH